MSSGHPRWDESELPSLCRDQPTHERDLDRWGFCLVADALSASDVAAVRQRGLQQAEAERQLGLADFAPDGNQWINTLINKGQEFRSCWTNAVVRDLARYLIGEDHLLFANNMAIANAGNTPMVLHTDQPWTPQPRLPGEPHVRIGNGFRETRFASEPTPSPDPINPPFSINAVFAITDFSPDNGSTCVVPGSHLSGSFPDRKASIEVWQPTMPAGSAIVFDSRIWHGTGQNQTDEPRIGVTLNYCAPYLRQFTNFTLALDPTIRQSLSDDELALLGFTMHVGYGNTNGHRNNSVATAFTEEMGRLAPS